MSPVGAVPLLQQGVVWIDQRTSQIVRIHTDLLQPVAAADAKQLTTVVDFSEVRLPGLPEQLPWLPQKVVITWRINRLAGTERHSYTDYRLYKSTVRVLPE